MSKIIDRQISKHFKSKGYFDRDTLSSFLNDLNPEFTESALTWRIHDLVKRKVIDQVKLGVYTISNKEAYKPFVSNKLAQLSKIVAKEFDELDYCLWSTEWLNDFTRHQLGTFFYILEVEKDFIEEIFNAYSESKQYRVYLDPTEDIMERYVESEISIVIKPLISRSPKQKITVKEKSKDNIYVPTLEKILIDVYSDAVTFYAIQGSEMDTLFENALKRYQINFTKLISYARRRNKEIQIKSYLENNFGDFVKGILE
ncbi:MULTISPECIES: DUF6577 family protein [Galbibacter]|uniref:Transcriptional regulator, AbiEi antitoxin, Type IV TA system n=1 Tax=Galbibacter pacificus TaxID=2996052 RepID=A0ABT6FSH2_9FLAO|nr:DUF6577 family protein [Galbibacter pacificus]MDG3582882.1 hypothetical protein [Galbibacter pacificus]MDG3585999.1 hypothetical protein [Galbibacter pacificus]